MSAVFFWRNHKGVRIPALLRYLPAAAGDALAGAAIVCAATGREPRPAALVGAVVAAILLCAYAHCVCGRSRLAGDGSPHQNLLYAHCVRSGFKCPWLMTLSRMIGLAVGGVAGFGGFDAVTTKAGCALALASLGWAAYMRAVAALAKGEDGESEGLGNRRYLLGLAAFAPLPACFFLPDARMALLPFAGCLFASFSWCAAVAPLWRAHGPEERRLAVRRAMDAILYMQVGFVLTVPTTPMLASAGAIWIAARLARRLASATP